MVSGEITIRVRYAETDRMGLLHHANYLVYFEEGRTELLRAQGFTYRDIEDQGFYLVLTKLQVRYRRPAYYDDLLILRTTIVRTTLVRSSTNTNFCATACFLRKGRRRSAASITRARFSRCRT